MSGSQIGAIIILVLILIVAGVIYYAYRKVSSSVREFSRLAFGTSSILEGLKKVDREHEVTPKSISSATGIYLPKITRDFPEFQYDEMKLRAENVLTSYLRSVDERNPMLLTEGTDDLKEKLRLRIDMLKAEQKQEHFDNIKINRTEIKNYYKTKGRCSIIFQSSVQYQHYLQKDGKTLKGNPDRLEQSRYDTEMIYIQDRELVEKEGEAGLGMVCPNCGAPLTGLGAKKCIYCDSPIVAFNIMTWNFSDIVER